MARTELDDLDAVRSLGAVPGPTTAVLARARAELRERMDAETREQPARASRRGSLRRRTLLGLVAAAATAAAVTAPAVLPLGSGDRPAASADAAAFLNAVATTAAGEQGDWKDAAFWYSRSRSQRNGDQPRTREIWLGHRTSGRIAIDGKDMGKELPIDGPTLFPVGGGTTTTWDGLWELPTDPGRLEQVLREGRKGTGNDAEEALFVAVGELLRETPVPPAVRAALYRVAAKVPRVRLLGAVTDAEGRSGVAVEFTGPDITARYVIDPDDGRLLEETSVLACPPKGQGEDDPRAGSSPQHPKPAIGTCGTLRTTYLLQGPVADHRSRPKG
jgi:hypothetical protein